MFRLGSFLLTLVMAFAAMCCMRCSAKDEWGNTHIEQNIYYKTFEDASVYEFKKNRIDYKKTVFDEFLPVVRKFRRKIEIHDLEGILRTCYSPETLRDLMKHYRDKNYSFAGRDEFIGLWIRQIKGRNEIVYLRTSPYFIIDESIDWNRHRWIIEPYSYTGEDGTFVYVFDLVATTGKKGSPMYAFRFMKEKGGYRLRMIDCVMAGEGVPPFYH